jgi:hypothetical protein
MPTPPASIVTATKEQQMATYASLLSRVEPTGPSNSGPKYYNVFDSEKHEIGHQIAKTLGWIDKKRKLPASDVISEEEKAEFESYHPESSVKPYSALVVTKAGIRGDHRCCSFVFNSTMQKTPPLNRFELHSILNDPWLSARELDKDGVPVEPPPAEIIAKALDNADMLKVAQFVEMLKTGDVRVTKADGTEVQIFGSKPAVAVAASVDAVEGDAEKAKALAQLGAHLDAGTMVVLDAEEVKASDAKIAAQAARIAELEKAAGGTPAAPATDAPPSDSSEGGKKKSKQS